MNKFKFLPVLILFLLTLIFFKPFILQGKLPIPSDTIVGLYYPFRDAYFKTNPNGLPYKNFLITDPVRQIYPWRNLSINQIKDLQIPLWNSYNLSGTPLLANFQSVVFYPFNLLFFLIPFNISWSILIFIQPLLAGIFLYYYLNNLKLKKTASFLGALAFSFSGFSIAWLEWGTVLNTALWLPLILLATDKIFDEFRNKYNRKVLYWSIAFVFAFVSSFFAGHLQTFFYLGLSALFYIITRLILSKYNFKKVFYFIFLFVSVLIITAIQWLPTIKFILLSARNLDLVGWSVEGWFIPWQNLIQFIAPDFFGNPSTLNYYGIWNYAEFIGYVGILPLILAFFALFFRRDKKTLFFGTIFFVSLIFALPTFIAKIPFKFEIPFLSTSQPTRLLFLIDFSLSVLAAFGLDYFIRLKEKKLIIPVLITVSSVLLALWVFVFGFNGNIISPQNLTVAKQNLILPTILFILVLVVLLFSILNKKEKVFNLNLFNFSLFILILITVFDLFRFGRKFEPFTENKYLFPSTQVTEFLQKQRKPFRILSVDSRIMPPNFSIMYKLQTLDGYDPLYLQRFGELMAASGRGEPNIRSPFGFNRIITPQDPLSRITDMLGTKYILSLNDLKDKNFSLVFSDGTTKVYENSKSLPRAFFVSNTLIANSKQEAINSLFDLTYPLNARAVVEEVGDRRKLFKESWNIGKVEFIDYKDNKVVLETSNSGDGFMVLTDSYYPLWHATIDGRKTKIYITNYNYRGIIVPKGDHKIEFFITFF